MEVLAGKVHSVSYPASPSVSTLTPSSIVEKGRSDNRVFTPVGLVLVEKYWDRIFRWRVGPRRRRRADDGEYAFVVSG